MDDSLKNYYIRVFPPHQKTRITFIYFCCTINCCFACFMMARAWSMDSSSPNRIRIARGHLVKKYGI